MIFSFAEMLLKQFCNASMKASEVLFHAGRKSLEQRERGKEKLVECMQSF